jgi:hypothetical protein
MDQSAFLRLTFQVPRPRQRCYQNILCALATYQVNVNICSIYQCIVASCVLLCLHTGTGFDHFIEGIITIQFDATL